jgi:hypothetical protein
MKVGAVHPRHPLFSTVLKKVSVLLSEIRIRVHKTAVPPHCEQYL